MNFIKRMIRFFKQSDKASTETEIFSLLSDFREAVKKQSKPLPERLNSPVSTADLERFESEFDIKLPSELVEMYQVHDGEGEFSCLFGGWRWLPIAEVASQIKEIKSLEKDGFLDGTIDTSDYIPVFRNDDGVLFSKPSLNKSSLFLYESEYPDETKLVANDTAEFITSFLKDYESGIFRYSETEARGGNTFVHFWASDGKPWYGRKS